MSAPVSLKEKIKQMAGDNEQEIVPDEFSNLILDDTQIVELSEEDGKYLDTFSNLEKLCMNATCLKNLNNLPPTVKLMRLELSDNKLDGSELSKLSVYKDTLTILKVSNNKVTTLDQIKCLSGFEHLIKLDFSENDVCKVDQYREKVFELLPNLIALDGQDQDGKSVYSEEDDELDEEGEFDMDGMFDEEMLAKLDPEMRKKVENGELGYEELKALGVIPADDDYGDEFGEEGEEEKSENINAGEEGGDKK